MDDSLGIVTVAMTDNTDQLIAVLQLCRETFGEYAQMHLAKQPPAYDKAERNIAMAALCDRVLLQAEPVNSDAPTDGVRSVTIDLSDFVYNVASPFDHDLQERGWLENRLAERGFRYCVPLSNMNKLMDSDGAKALYWRVPADGPSGQVWQFNERVT